MKKLLKCVSLLVLTFILIPIVKADGPSEAITSGKLTLKSIPLVDEETRAWYTGNILIPENFPEWKGYNITVNADDAYKGVLKKYDDEYNLLAEKNVVITYEYDETIKKVAESLIKDLGTDMIQISLNDIEAMTYIVSANQYLREHPEYNGEMGFPFQFANFSGELMKKLQYKNFTIDIGAGGGYGYLTNRNMGELSFTYNDTYYGKGHSAEIIFRAIVYVPEDSTDIIKDIKNRVSKYFDVEDVTAAYTVVGTEHVPYTVEDYLKDSDREFYNTCKLDDECKDIISEYADVDAYLADISYDFEDEDFKGYMTADSQIYDIELKSGMVLHVVAVKDDEGAADEREFKTSDAGTGIEISTDGIIPLDALIQVARVTSGDEYDKIVKVIKNNNVDMFDLKMITKSNETITKLDNGKFRVKLPIKEEFKGKELKVYYVGEDDKVEEYKVTISDDGNYAIFETNHFSIYTLAAGAATKNPKTGDSIMIYVATLILSSAYLLTRKLRKN